MKKLMTSTIIILPLILLAILLVSGAVLSFSAHIYVETVELSKKDTIILVMDNESNVPTYNLGEEVTVLPVKATNQKLNFTSDNEDVVTIDSNGIIHANFYGETYVTVTSKENLAASATRKVVVTDDKVHAVKINEQFSDLYQDEKISLTANIYPKEAENKGIKWTSSNPAILNVSANGTATAIGSGVAKVIATSVENESIYAELEITCHKKLTGITFDISTVQTTSEIVEFPEVTALPNDIDANDVTYSYSSNNIEVASVDKFGKIKFSKPGSVVISVTASDYKGETATEQKTFTSTMGYFTKPIFAEEEISWSNCHEGEELSSDWLNPQLEGTYKGITSIECLKDGSTPVTDVIKFENNKFVFGANLECDAFIEVTIHSEIFNFDTNSLEDYSETIKINKSPSQSGINAVVKLNGSELSKGGINNISIKNLNEQIVLQISNSEATPKISSNTFVGVNIMGNDITLTGKASCENVNMDLSIGVSKYKLQLTVKAKADIIEVNFGGTKLQNLGSYNTLLDALNFDIKLNRTDGKKVTDNTIQYSLNEGGEYLTTETPKLEIETSSNRSIKIKSGTTEFSFEINKSTLADFGIKINTSKSTLATIDSVKDISEYLIRVPSDVQDQLTMQIITEDEFLGGFGNDETFENMFNVNLFELEGWNASFSSINKQITLEFAGKQEFNNKVALTYEDLTITLQFIRVNLTSIDFEGFDMGNLYDDMYLGYQQVRVFAKHSYYGGVVDYFKIPFKAISSYLSDQPANPEVISWILTRVNDDKNEKQIITSQLGYEVTFNGTTYTITKDGDDYVLKDASGDVVVDKDCKNPKGIIWVDVFSEPGYARIYFGNFAGLTESDIQNDYFGNFANEENWVKPSIVEDDHSGRKFSPSENAFSFLRVEAGDGAEGGTGRFFNFNVLDDTALINVVDADGYYANKNVVLQNSFSHDVLTSSERTKLSKTIIYGNGYEVNLKALNSTFTSGQESNPIQFDRLYNVYLWGDSANETINKTTQKTYIDVEYAYYCDVRYYYKLSAIGADGARSLYIKNSVLSCVPKTAIQLYYGAKLYAENITMADCGAGISVENKGTEGIYLKGFVDILDYNNKTGIINLAGGGIASMVIGNVFEQAQNYFEWFGLSANDPDKVFVNVVIFSTTNTSNKIYVWRDNDYVAEGDKATLNEKVSLKNIPLVPELGAYYYAWTYDDVCEKEGGKVDVETAVSFNPFKDLISVNATRENLNKLFTDERYLRLLCEYKTNGTKNTDHILWHEQQVYRNPNLIKGREQNHIEHLKSTLKDVVWPDNSTANEAIELSNQIITNTNLYIILPNKKQQLF